jgi:iron complex outermembrane recepter protein
LNARTGFYANYSEGFVPPQVTEMYTGVKVPALTPAVFRNYEAGGWAELVRNKLSVDFSIYRLEGRNEVVSVRLDDGSTENRNAGETLHKGFEFSVSATPLPAFSFRMGGAVSEHRFQRFVEKGVSYNGNEMAGAPRWIHNAEVWFRPAFAKGLRLGAEWQRVGAYYADPKNTAKYEGYHAFHLRAGYSRKGFEVWANLMNATNNYYAYVVTKSASGYSYQLGEPRHLTLGLSYDLGSFFKPKP